MSDENPTETVAALQRRVAELQAQLVALQHLADDLDTLFQHATDALFLHPQDDTGAILDVNETMLALYGVSRAEATSLRVQDYSSPRNDQTAIGQRLREALAGGVPTFPWIARRPADGSEFAVEVTLRAVTFRQQPCILATVRDTREHTRLEAAQQTSEERFQLLTETMPVACFIVQAGHYVYANAAAEQLTGYSRAELATLDLMTFVHPNDRELVLERAALRLRGETVPSPYEITLTPRQGDERRVELHSYRTVFADQPALFLFAHDVTDYQRQQDELRLFKLIVEHASDGISFADEQGRIAFSNAAHRAAFGYGAEIIGVPVVETIAPENLPLFDAALQEVMTHGSWRGESLNVRKDGTTFPVEVSIFPVQDETGATQTIVGFFRDITERKRAERELETFKMLIDRAPDGFTFSAPDGTLLYANRAYKILTGLGDAAIGMSSGACFDAASRATLVQDVLPILAEQETWQGTLGVQRPDGHYAPIHLTGVYIGTETIEWAAIWRDLTEQQRLEQEREALQEQIIAAQQAAIRELSSPLLPIADGILALPLVGSIDSARAAQVMETLLAGIAAHRARVVIIDITGVEVVDTQVAQALIQAAQAARLLGAAVILTGIQPQIAQTLVQLGVDLSGVATRSTLQAGIADVLHAAHTNELDQPNQMRGNHNGLPTRSRKGRL